VSNLAVLLKHGCGFMLLLRKLRMVTRKPREPQGSREKGVGMDPTTEAVQQSFEFAAESVKQLVTLSTGIIALMITFSKDLVGRVSPSGVRLLRTSWALYLASMLVGILAMGAMTGALAKDDTPSVYEPNILALTVLQWVIFLIGTGVLLVYAGRMLHAPRAVAAERSTVAPETPTELKPAAREEPQ
jgi:hypothetical protein